MRAKLSVIMPTLNAASELERSLPVLAEGLQEGLIRELILSDGGSNDATAQIAEAAGAVFLEGAPSRGGQLRRAADVAQGDWLLFLHADSCLPEGWAKVVSEQIQTGTPAVFRLAFDVRGILPKLVSGWANVRTQVFSLPYGDQGLLISRADYEDVGGYPDIPLMEDVAMARSLKGRLALLPMPITTSAAKYQRDGWLARGLRNISLLLRYFCGADPKKLASRY